MLDVPAITRDIARGDRSAFARLYEAKFDLVYAAASRASGRDEATCLDIVQEAMTRVIHKMKPLPDEPSLDAWLRCTTKRAAYDWLRAERRRTTRQTAAARGALVTRDGSAGGDAASEAMHDRAERLAWLRRELGALDRSAADALDLRIRAGMTLAQAGRLLGLTPGAVDGRVTRAVERLRERAKEEFDG